MSSNEIISPSRQIVPSVASFYGAFGRNRAFSASTAQWLSTLRVLNELWQSVCDQN